MTQSLLLTVLAVLAAVVAARVGGITMNCLQPFTVRG